ncbi:MAG: hypothetical protein OXG56_01590 [Gammaproteobacteria bacterium]|nr:hypothetical protein [Gammaproteobacteria bacterium]
MYAFSRGVNAYNRTAVWEHIELATKEDILEQIVEEYLVHKGYFVQHNIKFLPSKNHPDYIRNQDSNHSDIDVLGYHPNKKGEQKVMAVSCKSWQNGFNPASEIEAIEKDKILRGRKAWKAFRELTKPKWSDAFLKAVKDATGEDQFTYVTAVTHCKGEKDIWEDHKPFRDALRGNRVAILTIREMASEIRAELTTTLATTEVGRMLQLFSAAGIDFADDR